MGELTFCRLAGVIYMAYMYMYMHVYISKLLRRQTVEAICESICISLKLLRLLNLFFLSSKFEGHLFFYTTRTPHGADSP